ncbi:SpoIIE family protein phosphatase [Streptomyces sp. AK02-01A]|uniref:ATP-binding SpoIIE family protein phosphatase n=1 Tax=Streptomyces sp. AK02-01A TaxID=3028648 RepID=UPI0029B6996D|nr:SpoIIE family protein phosphatase [Streptomyces sp. AK02-01A]MDX3853062.1 SpoIIE family protein phosphatase [Streptomyces sp. AK02-01A]
MARDDPLLIVDAEGVVVRWSARAATLFGRRAEDVLGRQAADLLRDRRVAPASADRLQVPPGLTVGAETGEDGSVVWAVRASSGGEGQTDGAALEALFRESPVGLFVLDADLRLVRVNQAGRAMSTVAVEEILGLTLSEILAPAEPEPVDRMVREALPGRLSRDTLLRVRAGPEQAPTTVLSLASFRLEDAGGQAIGVAISATDVTCQDRIRTRLRVADAVRDRVGTTLDVVTTCQELADTVVPEFADIVVVDVVESVVCGEDPPLGQTARTTPLRRAAFRGRDSAWTHDDAFAAPAYPVGDVRSMPARTPFAQSLVDLRPRLISVRPDAPWLAAEPERAEVLRAWDARSLIVTPLALHGGVLGLVSFYRVAGTPAYVEEDVDTALSLASRAAVCVDNARRFTREHTVAATLQRRLLPPGPTTGIALETAHLHLLGTEGGGGWFDTIALSGSRTALVIGEVAGRGIQAAATMGQLRTAIRSLAALDFEPDDLLARLNDIALFLADERADLPSGDPLHRRRLTASCLYAVYDPFTLRCTVACAGHPGPLIIEPDGAVHRPDLHRGPVLGTEGGTPFATSSLRLAEGSVLALHSAAMPVSASASARAGVLESLSSVLADPSRPLAELCDEVLYTLREPVERGDAVLLLARTRPFPADRVASWELDCDSRAPEAARAHARRQLRAWRVPADTAYETELITSELVTNAVLYGAPEVSLRLINSPPRLTCEVHDSGGAAPRLRHARAGDEGGRGLFIVSQLAPAWGVRYTDDGKAVWTEQHYEQPAADR